MRRDTHPEAAELQWAVLRRLSGAERLAIAFDMSELVRELALAGLRQRFPDRSDAFLGMELLRSLYPSLSLPPPRP